MGVWVVVHGVARHGLLSLPFFVPQLTTAASSPREKYIPFFSFPNSVCLSLGLTRVVAPAYCWRSFILRVDPYRLLLGTNPVSVPGDSSCIALFASVSPPLVNSKPSTSFSCNRSSLEPTPKVLFQLEKRVGENKPSGVLPRPIYIQAFFLFTIRVRVKLPDLCCQSHASFNLALKVLKGQDGEYWIQQSVPQQLRCV